MTFKQALTLFAFMILTAFPSSAFAKYNPATDNPYIQTGSGASKKWYEFYKKDKQSAYISKNSGYWYSTEKENVLVRGTKTVLGGIKEIVQSAL
jgi:hypothetical protein